MKEYKHIPYEKFLIDENGKRYRFLFEIDVREALASGKYFVENTDTKKDEEVLVNDEELDLEDNLEIIRK